MDRIFGPLARRWSWAATALKLQKRVGEINGGFIASAVTLNMFLSLFPLLLVAIAVIGFITSGDSGVTAKIINNLGLTGQSAKTMNDALQHASDTKKAASIIGLVGLLWSGLGVVSAIEHALDITWQQTGRGIKDKVRGLIWAVGALVILGASIALTTLVEVWAHGALLEIVSIAIALVINFGFWMWTFIVLAFKRVTWHAYAPGAVLAAIGLEIVKQLATLLPGLFSNSSALYGSLGVVFGILATLLLFGRIVVYASALNVVKWENQNGTVTLDIEVPKVPGTFPLEADRAGATQQPKS